MKIIDINVINNINFFIDKLLKQFINKNEEYLLIKDKNNYEIHFNGYIVRLYEKEYSKNDKVYILPINILNDIRLGNLFDKLNNKNINPEIIIKDQISFPEFNYVDLEPKIKKENPALKKLKKNDYKNKKNSRMSFKKYR